MRAFKLAIRMGVVGLWSLGCSVVMPCVAMFDPMLDGDVNLCHCDGIDACSLRCDPELPCDVSGCGHSVDLAEVDCTDNPFCTAQCEGPARLALDCTDAEVCWADCHDGQVCEVNCDGASDCGVDCADDGGDCLATNCEAGACTVSCREESKDGIEGGGTVSCG